MRPGVLVACVAVLWIAVLAGSRVPAQEAFAWTLPARTIQAGPYQGIGHDNPNKAAALHGFRLTPEQQSDLIAFLQSLTDDALLRDPRFANPWPVTRAHR
ncbi:MAG: hypothetical protein ABIQ52_16025 [Vicinamibacterales bacterium]